MTGFGTKLVTFDLNSRCSLLRPNHSPDRDQKQGAVIVQQNGYLDVCSGWQVLVRREQDAIAADIDAGSRAFFLGTGIKQKPVGNFSFDGKPDRGTAVGVTLSEGHQCQNAVIRGAIKWLR